MNDIDPSHIERIEAFLSADADDSTRAAFMADLARDPDLARSYEAYTRLETALGDLQHRKLRNALRDLEAGLPKVAEEAKRTPLRRWWPLAIAASVAIVALFISRMPDRAEQALALWEPEPGLPVLMNSGSVWNPIMNAYKQRQYEKAQELLAPLDSDTAYYFSGVIAFELETYGDAADAFGQVNAFSPWHSEALVREIIALIAAERITEAREVLAEATSTGQLSADKAEEFRKILE